MYHWNNYIEYIVISRVWGCSNSCANGRDNTGTMDFPGILTLCTTRPPPGLCKSTNL